MASVSVAVSMRRKANRKYFDAMQARTLSLLAMSWVTSAMPVELRLVACYDAREAAWYRRASCRRASRGIVERLLRTRSAEAVEVLRRESERVDEALVTARAHRTRSPR